MPVADRLGQSALLSTDFETNKPPMKRLEFINVTASDAAAGLCDALGVNDSSRRRIRVQVMKDFWRKEKQQKRILPCMTSPSRASLPAFRLIKEAFKESEKTQPSPAIPEPRIPPTLYAPEQWRVLFGSSFLQDHCCPTPPLSMMSNNVKTYFVRGRAPVVAILDSLTIMHVGSTAREESILLEARKRYVFAIASLRLDTTRTEPEMSLAGLLLVAMVILLSEVLLPIDVF
jgi:hypothetical protein